MIRHALARPPAPLALTLASALAAAATLAGCGGAEGPQMVKVSGTVSYQGKPLPRGTITFLPEGGGQPASGNIGTDGSYALQTVEPGDGARTGKYKVIVSTSDLNVETLDTAMLPGQIPKGKKLTPETYEKPETSGLTAEVTPSTTTLDFNLN